MAAKAKAFVAICALGGGCGGVRWLLRGEQKGDFGAVSDQVIASSSTSPSSSAPTSITPSPVAEPSVSSSLEQPLRETEISLTQPLGEVPALPPEETPSPQASIKPEKTNAGNCEVIDPPKEIFSDLWIGDIMSSYYSITCKNASTSSDDKRMEGEWIGLFPDTVMTDRQDLTVGKTLEIKTVTKKEGDGNRKTIFTGNKFQGNEITGEWTSFPQQAQDKWVETLTVLGGLSDSRSIYLLFSSENSEL